MASVVGASVVAVRRQVDAVGARARRAASPPNRSVESQPRYATDPPSRAIVRAVLNGPPPGTARERAVRVDEEVDEGLAGDDDHGRHGTWRGVPSTDDGPPHRRHRAARRPARRSGRRWPATCATCGRINRWLGGVALSRRRDRRAGRASTASCRCSTSGPAAPTSRSRSSSAPRRAAGSWSVVGARQPARGPRRGRPRPTRARGRRTASSSTSATAVAPLPRRLVRRRPLLAGRPPLHAGRGGRAVPRDGPRGAARRRRQRPRPRAGSAGSGPWLLGHLLTRNRYTRTRRAAVGRARLSARRDGRACCGGRPDAGPDDPRLVRPALRDRGRPDAGRADAAARRRTRRAPGSDATSGSTSRSSAAGRPARSWRRGWRGRVSTVVGPRAVARPGAGGPAASSRRPAAVDRPRARRPGRGRRSPPSRGRSRRCASRRRAGRRSG